MLGKSGCAVLAPLEALYKAFRCEAELLRRWGAEAQATAAEHAAARVKETLAAWRSEALTVAEAAIESGYSEAHLRRLLGECRIDNAGSAGRPRIRRADLPRKARQTSGGEVDLVGEVLQAREQQGL